MAPRPRNRNRRGWPDNLQGRKSKKNGKVYYSYRNPNNGQETALGSGFAEAKQAAIIANNALMRKESVVERLVNRIMGTDTESTFTDFLLSFKEDILPSYKDKHGRPYAEKTIKEYQRRIDLIRKEPWANKPMDAGHEAERVNLRDIASFLDAQDGDRTSNVYRQLLGIVFRHAVAKGLCKENLAASTLKKTVVKQRKRLSLEWFQAIRDQSPSWFQNALDMAIQTLQRREDLVMIRFADEREVGWLYVDQQKVEGHGTGHIKIAIGQELRSVIARCRASGIVSPFVIHRTPEKKQRRVIDAKEHWSQVSPEMLTRTFKELRDRLGLCDELQPNQRPSFHEVRALGADLYRKSGWPEDAVQRLLGHSSSKMTKVYLEGHDVSYIVAESGLKIAGVS